MEIDQVDDRLIAAEQAIASLEARVAALEAAPTGGTNPADEAMLDLSEALSVALNATDDLNQRAEIIGRLIAAL